MKLQLKPVLWSGIALIMLLLLTVPGVNALALLFMMVPYTILYTLLDKKQFALYVLIIWIIGALIIGPSFVLFLGMFFLVPGIIMGHFYRSGAVATKIISVLTAVLLGQLMLELLLLEVILKISLLNEIRGMIFDMTQQGLFGVALNSDMLEAMTKALMNMIPLAFAIMSFLVAACSHYVARRIVAKNGLNVQAFPEAKTWRVPRYFIFIYLIAYIMELSIDPFDQSFISIAILNLVPALSFLFTVQAIGFFFFLGDHKGWPKIVPLIIAIPIIFIPPLSIIGIIDTAFPLRKYFSKHN